jgi:hypothetical protein
VDIAGGVLVAQRAAAAREAKKCPCRQTDECRSVSPMGLTADTTAVGGSRPSTASGARPILIGCPVRGQGDSTTPGRPRTTGNISASLAHQVYNVRPLTVKRWLVGLIVRPGPTNRPCSSRSALLCASSAVSTSSTFRPLAAASRSSATGSPVGQQPDGARRQLQSGDVPDHRGAARRSRCS